MRTVSLQVSLAILDEIVKHEGKLKLGGGLVKYSISTTVVVWGQANPSRQATLSILHPETTRRALVTAHREALLCVHLSI